METKEEFELGEVESFAGNKDQQFSHSSLVMQSMRKTLELGSKEMREGWFNEKKDNQGNIIRTYIEDTRKAFIESVRTLKMIMACDLDNTAIARINKYLALIKVKEEELIQMGNDAWENRTVYQKQGFIRAGGKHYKAIISDPLLIQHFIKYELEKWRSIFSELSRLTKRLDFYKSESFEA